MMGEISYIKTSEADIELLMQVRLEMLIDEAKEKGVTEISLDATEMGRPLYEALGFENNCAGMVLELNRRS